MKNKTLGLLLLPFIPLTAIGIVEVAGSILPPQPIEQPITQATPRAPAMTPRFTEPTFARPPAPSLHTPPQTTLLG